MRRIVGDGENGIRWKFTSELDDLDFADDVVLIPLPNSRFRIKQQEWMTKP